MIDFIFALVIVGMMTLCYFVGIRVGRRGSGTFVTFDKAPVAGAQVEVFVHGQKLEENKDYTVVKSEEEIFCGGQQWSQEQIDEIFGIHVPKQRTYTPAFEKLYANSQFVQATGISKEDFYKVWQEIFGELEQNKKEFDDGVVGD